MSFLKSKIQRTWIYSIGIILLVLFAFVSMLMSWVIGEYSRVVSAQCQHLSSSLAANIDDRLDEIRLFSTQIEINAINLALSNASNAQLVSSSSKYALYAQLYNYKVSNNLVDSVYVYYPHSDFIIGDQGYFSARSYYLLCHGMSDIGYEQWSKNLRQSKQRGFRYSDGQLIFSKQQPYSGTGENTAVLVVRLNERGLETLLGYSRQEEPTYAYMIVSENVFSGSDTAEAIQLAEKIRERQASDEIFSVRDYSGSCKKSIYESISYIVLTRRTAIMAPVYMARNVSISALVALLLFGLFLSIVVSRRNTKPIKELARKYAPQQGNSPTAVDEYKMLDTVLSESENARKKTLQQKQYVDRLFLENLLTTQQRSGPMIFAAMQKMDIEFLYPQFQVVVFRSLRRKANEARAPYWDEVMGAVSASVRDKPFMSARYHNELVLLFNLDSDVTEAQLQHQMAELYRQVASYGPVLLAVGRRYDTLSHILDGYREADATARRYDESGVYYYDRMATWEKMETPENTTIHDFQKCLRDKDPAAADRLLPELAHSLQSTHDRDLARVQRDAVAYATVQALGTATAKKETMEELTKQLCTPESDIDELLCAVQKALKLLTEQEETRGAGRRQMVAKRALEIIRADYTNPMLSLYSISDQLEVSNTYLSAAFKEVHRTGIVQYIHSLRIERAKQLLSGSDESIKDIAVQVGYTSDMSFIRVFKQYEEITPGKFRENFEKI